MTTPEQQAREMLEKATSSDLPVIVADIIAENTALKAELAAIKGAGERAYCFAYEWDTPFGAVHRSLSPSPYNGNSPSRIVFLYTRPCVPLTEADIDAIFEGVPGDPPHRGYRYRVARAIEAHIKGAKP